MLFSLYECRFKLLMTLRGCVSGLIHLLASRLDFCKRKSAAESHGHKSGNFYIILWYNSHILSCTNVLIYGCYVLMMLSWHNFLTSQFYIFHSLSTTSSWSGKNVNQSHVMPSRVPSRNSLKKEEISAPKVPDDGVYNPFCNIMGINVPLKRRHSSDTIDSGYAYNPFGQLEYEERFTVE